VKILRLFGAIAAGTALLAGCATPGADGPSPLAAFFQGSPGEKSLSAGIKQFEEGEYPDATKSLQSAIEGGLSRTSDRTKAHKYLAFIHCVSGRPKQCQDEFRKVIEIDPAFELDPSEAGHPIWGPEFRNAKARTK
jgi:Tfp pilus assembly protein PilF